MTQDTISADELRCLIDLHLHLDGSLSLDSVKELAEVQHIAIPESDGELRKALEVSEGCRDLNEYLEKFDFPGSLLQTREGLRLAVKNLIAELAGQGLIYAEIRFAPQKHCEKGMTQEEAVLAAIEGQRDAAIPTGLILCCMRGNDNREENLETVRVGAKLLGRGVCAVDLAGAEALFPTKDFEEIFALAKELGVPCTIHAGEADGPDSIRTALSFGALRIGHGVRCCEDAGLMAELAEKRIPLELCPTSNLNTCVFPELKDYPLPALLSSGIPVTVNTDNMSVSATNLRRELGLLAETFSLSKAAVGALLCNAARASFADEATRASLLSRIEAYYGL